MKKNKEIEGKGYAASQLILDIVELPGKIKPETLIKRYEGKNPQKKVVKVQLLYCMEEDGEAGSGYALVYVNKAAKARVSGVQSNDLYLTACSYPGSLKMSQIIKSCKTQYKTREFVKAKLVENNPDYKYVVELYKKKKKR